MAAFTSLAIVSQLYLNELGASRFLISLCAMSAGAATMVFSAIWGRLSDALGTRRRLIILSALLSTLMVLVPIVSRSVGVVLSGRFLVEAFGAGVAPTALAMLSEEGGAIERGRRLSVFYTAQGAGFLTGLSLGGALYSTLGPAGAYGFIAALSSVSVIASLFMPHPAAETGSAGGTLPNSWQGRNDESPGEDRLLLWDDGLWLLYAGVVLRRAGSAGVYGLLIVYLSEEIGLQPWVASVVFALNPLGQVLFMPIAGRLCDRVGRRRVALAGHLLSSLIPLMIWQFNAGWLLAGTLLLAGLTFSAYISGVTAHIGDSAQGRSQGRLMGLLRTSSGLGGILGPLIAGAISSPIILDYEGMFVTMALLTLGGFFLSLLGLKSAERQVQPV